MTAILKTTVIQEPSSATNNLTLSTSGGVTVGQNLTVTGNQSTTGTVAMGSAFTMRNLIINGAMQIWQRGTSFTNTSAGGNFYTADRWATNRVGNATGITTSRSTSAPTDFQYSLALQRTAADTGTAALYLYNSNETVNCVQFQGSSLTLSFYAKTGTTYSGGAISVQVLTGTGTDERVYAYTGSSTIINTTQAITTTWTRYTFTGTVPSNATEIGFTISWTPSGTAGADDTVYITGCQIEQGNAATPFEYRNYQQELAMCQRYFVKSYDTSTVAGTVTQNGAIQINASATSFNGCCNTAAAFPSEMRTAGTATYYSPITGASGKAGVIGGSDFTAQGTAGTRNISMSTTTGPASATVQITYHYTVSSEL